MGRKIGLTSPAVQPQLGVYSPDFGALLDDMAYTDREPIDLGRFLQPRVEAEVAFVLGHDLDSECATVADVIRATDYVLPAHRDRRLADGRLGHRHRRHGRRQRLERRLRPRYDAPPAVRCRSPGSRHGDRAARRDGLDRCGRRLPGHPGERRGLARPGPGRRGTPLRAGESVLSGALGPMVPVTGPGVFTARLSGLGEVSRRVHRGANA